MPLRVSRAPDVHPGAARARADPAPQGNANEEGPPGAGEAQGTPRGTPSQNFEKTKGGDYSQAHIFKPNLGTFLGKNKKR